ncbi:hypothetical protein AMTRI_Chr02g224090 [Amborella trichopoda]|uniref:L-gulonolactone oxidase 2 isoform X2 n=1 Tax=Amborella trichopoda TaxID=13333 RepID=UPI0005D32A5E|nr:L-gulonolactone oxidase 2 isoform X2 [Amborella trichopoda]|eukprot:XP_011621860.1 L-gulonolactone oxidase 2 isoform X2 [Amborella trichopoda]
MDRCRPHALLVALTVVLLTARPSRSMCPACTVLCSGARGPCGITNYRGAWQDGKSCVVSRVEYPSTEEELVAAVANAVREGRPIKLMGPMSHTANRFPCPGGDKSGVLINTRDLNSFVSIDQAELMVTADAGVKVRDLAARLASSGLTLTQTPYFDAVTIGGVISMGAHGSGLRGGGGAVHEYIVRLRMVVAAPPNNGFAKVVELGGDDESRHLFDAARVSIGTLGAISRVTLRVERMFKRQVFLSVKGDEDLEDTLVEHGKEHEFGDITWYPSLGKVVYRIDDRVSNSMPGHGRKMEMAFRPQTVDSIVKRRLQEEQIQASRDSRQLCNISKNQFHQGIHAGAGFLNDGKSFHGFPVVGFNNMMQSSSACQACDQHCNNDDGQLSGDDQVCAWDPRINGSFYFHSSIAVPLRHAASAIGDIKRLAITNPNTLCAVDFYGGLLMRFLKKSQAHLGNKEDAIHMEFFYYSSRRPEEPRWNEHIMEEMEQILLFKYSGRPHWAKNRVYAFKGVTEKVADWGQFVKVKKEMDSLGFFSSAWSDTVLGLGSIGRVERRRPRCALDGLCVCESDLDCAPEAGLVCANGTVWSRARVCRPSKI